MVDEEKITPEPTQEEQIQAINKERAEGLRDEDEEKFQKQVRSFWDNKTKLTPQQIHEVLNQDNQIFNEQTQKDDPGMGYSPTELAEQSMVEYQRIIGHGMKKNHALFERVWNAIQNDLHNVLSNGLTLYFFLYGKKFGKLKYLGRIRVTNTYLEEASKGDLLIGKPANEAANILKELGIVGSIDENTVGTESSMQVEIVMANYEYQ